MAGVSIVPKGFHIVRNAASNLQYADVCPPCTSNLYLSVLPREHALLNGEAVVLPFSNTQKPEEAAAIPSRGHGGYRPRMQE